MTEEIKTLIQAQGVAFEEFKKTNDARLAAVEGKGADSAPADLLEKLSAINADLTAYGKDIADIKKSSARALFSGSGEQISEEKAAHKLAFGEYLRKGKDNGLREIEQKAMNMGSDPNGGYLVEAEMDTQIRRVAQTISAMDRISRHVTIGTARWETLVKTAGMSMRRIAEGGAGGETTEPTYAKIGINVYEAEVEPWVYNATLADAFIDLESDLANEAAIGFAEGLALEYFSGAGTNGARGITAYTNVINSSHVWGKVGYIVSGKSAAFASVAPADALINLQHGLKSQYRPGAVFVMSDATLATVRQMKDSSGAYYLWQPDTTAGFGGRLLGSPVEIDDNFSTVAANSYSLAYGDFKQAYAIVDRAGISLIRDDITTKGTTKFNFRKRSGGGIVNYEALKLMKFATT